jgi:hypothetical protein
MQDPPSNEPKLVVNYAAGGIPKPLPAPGQVALGALGLALATFVYAVVPVILLIILLNKLAFFSVGALCVYGIPLLASLVIPVLLTKVALRRARRYGDNIARVISVLCLLWTLFWPIYLAGLYLVDKYNEANPNPHVVQPGGP